MSGTAGSTGSVAALLSESPALVSTGSVMSASGVPLAGASPVTLAVLAGCDSSLRGLVEAAAVVVSTGSLVSRTGAPPSNIRASLHIIEGEPPELLERHLRNHDIDLMIGRLPTPTPATDADVEVLLHENGVVVAGLNNLWARRTRLGTAERALVTEEPVLLLTRWRDAQRRSDAA